jgi:hemerythrin-like domain-containing protein
MPSETSKILSEEHQNILKIIEILENESDAIENGKELDKDFFEKIIDFIRNYADKFHHAKEEDILFKEFNKALEKNPKSAHCNPTEQMLIEHDEGRNFIKGMETRLNENDKIRVIRNARAYADLLKQHISKEDDILYPMTDEALDNKTKKEILKKFKDIEEERKKDKDKYLNMIMEFEKR